MNRTKNTMRDFAATNSDRLLEVLKTRRLMSTDEADAIVHALVDIAVSMEKVYAEMIPAILRASESPDEVLKDRLWDLREELRHIDYHIHDSQMTEI